MEININKWEEDNDFGGFNEYLRVDINEKLLKKMPIEYAKSLLKILTEATNTQPTSKDSNLPLNLVSNYLTIKKSEADEYNTRDSGGQLHKCKCGNDYLFENYKYCPKCGVKLTFV